MVLQVGSLEEHQHHQERERNTDFGDPAPDLPNRLSAAKSLSQTLASGDPRETNGVGGGGEK